MRIIILNHLNSFLCMSILFIQQRFPYGKRLQITLQEELQRQMRHAQKGCVWFAKTSGHLLMVLIRVSCGMTTMCVFLLPVC